MEKFCSIEGCGKRHLARTWCKKHYSRWKSHGDPNTVLNEIYPTSEDSFLARTQRQGECLIWTGSKIKYGYGNIRSGGRTVLAHRWAYEQEHGNIPEGKVIDHRCHNKSCVEVSHLRVVSQQQNMENQSGPSKNGTSGHLNVTWSKNSRKWRVVVSTRGRTHSGGYYPEYELHVAAFKARSLRNRLLTYNDRDKEHFLGTA